MLTLYLYAIHFSVLAMPRLQSTQLLVRETAGAGIAGLVSAA